MAYYTMPTTHNTNVYHKPTSYHTTDYTNNWYGNGYTAMQWAKRWYPGWQPYSYRWYNNSWWVYMRYGHEYRTVYIGPNYSWHWYRVGYWH